MQPQVQQRSLASSQSRQSLVQTEPNYHQKLSQRGKDYTSKDIEKYTLVVGTITAVISAVFGWLFAFVLHPVLAAILAIAVFVVAFVGYLRIRNRRRAAREIYDEQNQDIDILLEERPNLAKEIQKLSVYRYRFLTLNAECRKSPYHELPDELKGEAKKLQEEIEPYLDEDVKKYLAKSNNDGAHMEAILLTLERRIMAVQQPPQLLSRKPTNQT